MGKIKKDTSKKTTHRKEKTEASAKPRSRPETTTGEVEEKPDPKSKRHVSGTPKDLKPKGPQSTSSSPRKPVTAATTPPDAPAEPATESSGTSDGPATTSRHASSNPATGATGAPDRPAPTPSAAATEDTRGRADTNKKELTSHPVDITDADDSNTQDIAGANESGPESHPIDITDTDDGETQYLTGANSSKLESHPIDITNAADSDTEDTSPTETTDTGTRGPAETGTIAKPAAGEAPPGPSQTPIEAKVKQVTDKAAPAVCAEPVNAITGAVVHAHTDFTIPGRIELIWKLYYNSQITYHGVCGAGWQSVADARLEVDPDGFVTFFDGNPGGAVFATLPTGTPVTEAANGAILHRSERDFCVRLKNGRTYHFDGTLNRHRTLVSGISDPHGNRWDFIRDNNTLIRIESSAGTAIEVHNDNGRINRMTLGDRTLVRYRYQGRDLVDIGDALGNTQHFAYRDHRLTRYTNLNGINFHYTYDAKKRCIHSWGDDRLYDYRFEYPAGQRATRVIDSRGYVKTFTYDAYDLPLTVTDQNGHITRYTYDAVGRVQSITDPLARVTRYTWDQNGNLLMVTRPDNTRIRYAYNRQHRPVRAQNPNGNWWHYQYTPAGQLREQIDPLGNRTVCTYSAQGDPHTITDPEGHTTRFEFDNQGLLKTGIDPAGHRTAFQRDLMGRVIAVTDAAGRITRYRYDPKGRLENVTHPGGIRHHYEWDPAGNLLQHIDPNGHVTAYTYTGVNELAGQTNPDGSTAGYEYDTEENLIRVTIAGGLSHHYEYDPAGRLIAETDYYGQTTHYTYDPAGQLIRRVNPEGQTVDYTYDALGRLIATTLDGRQPEHYRWDGAGNLTGFENAAVRTRRAFNAANHLIREQAGDFVVEYRYSPCGRRTRRTTSTGNTVAYTYGPAGHLSGLTVNDRHSIRIDRDPLGRIKHEILSPALSRTCIYDPCGRISRQLIHAVPHIDRGYTWDPADRLRIRSDNHKGNQHFDYDAVGRITKHIDPAGRPHDSPRDAAETAAEPVAPDKELRTEVYAQATCRFGQAGNLHKRQTPQAHSDYYWDALSRLTTVRQGDAGAIRFTYDALGRRHTKQAAQRSVYTWDGNTLLSEQTGDDPAREYLFYPGTFTPLALIDSDKHIYYFHNDPNDLPQELTTAGGTRVWSARYDAFARVDRQFTDTIKQPLRMAGQYFDDETGLAYNRHRYYDPLTCRYISKDPIGLAGGLDAYAYAPNVWSWVDPLGLCKAQVEIYGFRGGGKAAFDNFVASGKGPAEVYTGHVAISADDGKSIFGFGPQLGPDDSLEDVIKRLKNHELFPGIIHDDTQMINNAIQGKFNPPQSSKKIDVYRQKVPVDQQTLANVKATIDAGQRGPLPGRKYGFPQPGTDQYNCATCFGADGVKLPEPTGNLREYIRAMKEQGATHLNPAPTGEPPTPPATDTKAVSTDTKAAGTQTNATGTGTGPSGPDKGDRGPGKGGSGSAKGSGAVGDVNPQDTDQLIGAHWHTDPPKISEFEFVKNGELEKILAGKNQTGAKKPSGPDSTAGTNGTTGTSDASGPKAKPDENTGTAKSNGNSKSKMPNTGKVVKKVIAAAPDIIGTAIDGALTVKSLIDGESPKKVAAELITDIIVDDIVPIETVSNVLTAFIPSNLPSDLDDYTSADLIDAAAGSPADRSKLQKAALKKLVESALGGIEDTAKGFGKAVRDLFYGDIELGELFGEEQKYTKKEVKANNPQMSQEVLNMIFATATADGSATHVEESRVAEGLTIQRIMKKYGTTLQQTKALYQGEGGGLIARFADRGLSFDEIVDMVGDFYNGDGTWTTGQMDQFALNLATTDKARFLELWHNGVNGRMIAALAFDKNGGLVNELADRKMSHANTARLILDAAGEDGLLSIAEIDTLSAFNQAATGVAHDVSEALVTAGGMTLEDKIILMDETQWIAKDRKLGVTRATEIVTKALTEANKDTEAAQAMLARFNDAAKNVKHEVSSAIADIENLDLAQITAVLDIADTIANDRKIGATNTAKVVQRIAAEAAEEAAAGRSDDSAAVRAIMEQKLADYNKWATTQKKEDTIAFIENGGELYS